MLIRYMSDIHWEFDKDVKWRPQELDTDKDTILILAGDLFNGFESFYEISSFFERFKYVLVVLGNHDYYQQDINSFGSLYRGLISNHSKGMRNVILLDKTTIEIEDYLFVGATLWTDMDKHNPTVIISASKYMVPDFENIKKLGQHYQLDRITAYDWLHHNQQDYDYIKNVVSLNKDKKIIIVTHYGCSRKSIHERFLTYGLANYYFINEYDNFIFNNPQIKYWFHGHVHDKMSYKIGKTQVLTNPRGYPNENSKFDEISLLEI